MRILIVEDDEGSRDGLKTICQELLGHQAAGVSSAEAAIGLMDMIKPHVVFVDYTLAKMNGVELIKEIKRISPFCHVVMVSGTGMISVVVEAIRAGANDFIPKPYSVDDIIRSLVDAQRKMDEPQTLEEIEKRHIENVVSTSATQREAAKKLGINTATLWRKLKEPKAA